MIVHVIFHVISCLHQWRRRQALPLTDKAARQQVAASLFSSCDGVFAFLLEAQSDAEQSLRIPGPDHGVGSWFLVFGFVKLLCGSLWIFCLGITPQLTGTFGMRNHESPMHLVSLKGNATMCHSQSLAGGYSPFLILQSAILAMV